jgi:cytidyltransferase-like protein
MQFSLQDSGEVERVRNLLLAAKAKGKIVGLTSGCFDITHPMHFQFFLRCRRNCHILVVGVDSDEQVRLDKGPTRPVFPDFQRAIMVDALKPVDFTFIMNGIDEFGKVAELIKPGVLFKNDSFKGREHEILGKEHADRIMIIHDQEIHTSTTAIITALSRSKRKRKRSGAL